ncbi:hypothetical protein ABKN59_002822 [Abortiporus biennis]
MSSSILTIIWEKFDPDPDYDPSPDRDALCKTDFSGYPSFNSEELVFYPVTRIYCDGMECDVYRGPLHFDDKQYDAAVKIRFGSGASHYGQTEAKSYCLPEIQRVQGKLVPRFYGLFEGGIQRYEARTSCLVLEYVGEQIPWPVKSMKLRKRVFDHLCELHKEEITHGIPAFEHVCRHPDGRIVFTHLNMVSVNHNCPSARHPAPPGEQLRIWTPAYFSCYGHQVKSGYAYPEPKLHDLVKNEAPKDMPRLEAERKGCEAIMTYLEDHRPKTYKQYKEELVDTLLRIEDEEDAPILREIHGRASRKLKKARSRTPTQRRSRSLTPTPKAMREN